MAWTTPTGSECRLGERGLVCWLADFLSFTLSRFVFFLDPCNVDLVQRRIRSLALCVSHCPAEELRTYQDLQRFGMVNGRSHDLSRGGYVTGCSPLPIHLDTNGLCQER